MPRRLVGAGLFANDLGFAFDVEYVVLDLKRHAYRTSERVERSGSIVL